MQSLGFHQDHMEACKDWKNKLGSGRFGHPSVSPKRVGNARFATSGSDKVAQRMKIGRKIGEMFLANVLQKTCLISNCRLNLLKVCRGDISPYSNNQTGGCKQETYVVARTDCSAIGTQYTSL
jgi:hypothetical protein